MSYQLISKHISFCLLTASSPLLANPTGGDVVGGSATIDYGTTTIITQQTNKAIVNWQDFSINQSETTQFVQPSSSSVILNRVVGGNASQIMGKLQSNGTVFLVNPHGIVFGNDAVVDVGGLVASTASISNQHFMEGNYQFTDAPDNSSIINQGRITVAQSGYAALVAPNVVNAGVIHATLGEVVLASGKAFTVDLYGDSLITLDATSLVSSSMVKNSGVVIAEGGQVTLNAGATDALVESLINMDGHIQAQSIGQVKGKVVLLGNDNTTVTVAGNIDVSGKDTDETGGVIQATGRYLRLASGAVLDASGDAGGGTVHIGSDTFHNPNDPLGINTFGEASSLDTAQFVYGASDTVINANAINRGDGGSVVVWSDQNTWYYGNISATAHDGHGGRVETSGHYLDVAGIKVNTSSLLGHTGLWLLDPADILIVGTGVTSGGTFAGGNPNTFTPTVDTVTATINAADISTALASNNVIISTGGGSVDYHITFDSTFNNTNPISWATANTLTVLATGNIVFNAASATDNVMNLSGSGTVNLRSDSDSDGAGTVTLNNGRINGSGSPAQVNVYYNPTNFSSAVDYSSLVTGTATQTAYMLVHDTVAGKHLSDINLNATTRGQTYALSQNLSTGLTGFTPITDFTGKLSGANYTNTNYSITGLTTSGTGNRGLFANTNGATLSDLTLTNFNITTLTSGTTGSLVGSAVNTSFSNISVNNPTLTGVDDVGGMIGIASGSTFSNAFVTTNGNISGGNRVGGLIGQASANNNFNTSSSLLLNATTTMTITGLDYVGGLIGQISGTGSTMASSTLISASTTPGLITITGRQSGGLFGSFINLNLMSGIQNVTAMTNAANVIGGVGATLFTADGVGGIFGLGVDGTGKIINANITNTGNITKTDGEGSGSVGGITGSVYGITFNGNITNSGNVIGYIYNDSSTSMGGLFGDAIDCIFTGALSSTAGNVINTGPGYDAGVGGLIGYSDSRYTSTSSLLYTRSSASTIESLTYRNSSGTGGLIGTLNTSTSNYFSPSSAMVTSTTPGLITVNGGRRTGGLFGIIFIFNNISFTPGGTLFNDSNINSIATSKQYTGGVIGFLYGFASNAAISNNMVNHGNIIGDESTGGVIGYNYLADITGNMSSDGNVSGVTNIGGLIGYVDQGIVTGIHIFSGEVTGVTNTGGVAGVLSSSSLSTAGSAGSVTGIDATGGVVGSMSNSTISQVYVNSLGSISGTNDTGGIVGINDASGNITDALFGGYITSTGLNAGGIVGNNAGTVTNTLFAGNMNVTGATDVGALIGNNSGVINTSYYDTRLFSTSIGSGNAGGTPYNTNLEFYTEASYIGFAFPALWTLSGTDYYASLTFCSTGCKILLPVTPPLPPPAPRILSQQLVAGIVQTIATNQASATSSQSSVASFSSGLSQFTPIGNVLPPSLVDAMKQAGLSSTLLSQAFILNELNYTKEDYVALIAVLADYYDGNSCYSNGAGDRAAPQECQLQNAIPKVISRVDRLDTGYAIVTQRYHPDIAQEPKKSFMLSGLIDRLLNYYRSA